MRNRWGRRGRRRALLTAALLLQGAAALAQAPVDLPLPWRQAVDRPTWSLQTRLWDDPAGHRQAVELGATVVWPRGSGHWLWLQWSYASVDLGPGGAAARWPAAVDSAAAADGWPGERIVSGWTRPGVGLLADTRLPLLGAGRLAVGGTLPFSPNRLYPLGERSVGLDLAWRRRRDLGPGDWAVTLRRQWRFSAAGDELTDDAFPALTTAALDLSFPLGGCRLAAGGAWAHHRDGRLRLAVDLPLGAGWRVTAGWRRDLAGADRRPFRDLVTVSLRVADAAPAPPAGDDERPAHRRRGGW